MSESVLTVKGQRKIINRMVLQGYLDEVAAELSDPLDIRNAWLGPLKKALAEGRAEINSRFMANHNGTACVRANCFLIDQIFRSLFDATVKHLYPARDDNEGEQIAIVAVGGYGRGELAPQSDIDVLFLHHKKPSPRIDQIVETLLYLLWDVGLKVGHSTRSVDECLKQAKTDWTICTALLESRYVWGEKKLFGELRVRFNKTAMTGRETEFLDAKLAERDERHEKMGESRYVLEPNIKDGKGGLRDLHTLYWTAKFLYAVEDLSELVDEGALTKGEVERFAKAQHFLWSVRCHLHYLANRPDERLTFDVQPELAHRMGYQDRASSAGVERFMRHYFLVAKDVGDLTRIFLAAFEAAQKRRNPLSIAAGFFKKGVVEGFPIEAGRLSIPSPDYFQTEPLSMLRIFRAANRSGLDLHPNALASVTRALPLVKAAYRDDPEANALFVEVLCAEKDADKTLRQMNECGFLGKFMPDFGRVVAQMQYDMYHVYTTDEHTIRAVGILNRIEQGLLKEAHPLATKVMGRIQSRQVLYVAVLLHDIAKGRGGDHSELGAKVARKVCPRLGMSPDETETVAWLVLHHLAMSMAATKRDLEDPQTIEDFVKLVHTPERLRLLLCLTVVDIKAVGPNVWNNWKATLLRDLYWRAEEVMAGASSSEGRAKRGAAAKARLQARLEQEGWSEKEITAYLAQSGVGYFLALDTDTLVRHAKLVRDAKRQGDDLSLQTRVIPESAVTELSVYCGDHPGLVARLSGAISLAGGSVVDAKISTRKDGTVIDTFLIQDTEGGAFDRPDKLARLVALVRQSLSGEIRPIDELARRAKSALPSRTRVFTVAPRVLVDNRASANHTVIEVNGRDRPGLLYQLTHALRDQQVRINIAKISTYGEEVVDVFYVKDTFGMKIEHAGKLDQIRQALRFALIDGEEKTAPPPTKLARKTIAKKTARRAANRRPAAAE